jgi:tetratricopeptide (TPR) repeat protein
MSFDLRAGIVRILHPNGSTAGTGFIISADGLLVTCSHVIQDDRSQRDKEPRPESVTIIFHATGEKRQAKIKSMYWQPSYEKDLAFLRVEGELPSQVRHLALGSSVDTIGHDIRSFGFPSIDQTDGAHGKGEVLGKTTQNRQQVLQLRSLEFTVGFSGAPIWDETRHWVIGLIVSVIKPDAEGRLAQTAYAIPSETLQSVFPELDIQQPTPVANVPFKIHHLLQHFIPRSSITNEIKARLIKRDGFQTIAIYGLPGVGKATLAAQLVYEPEVQARFPNGVLWATLGPKPFLLSVLNEWIKVLDPLVAGLETNETLASERLKRLLQGKQMLLIIDDVWKDDWANRLLVGGLDCKALLITREQTLADEYDSMAHHIELLSEAEAVQMLAKIIERPIDSEIEAAKELARILGYLPLALALAGIQAKRRLDQKSGWRLNDLVKLIKMQTANEVLAQPGGNHLNDALAVSYMELDEDKKQLFRLLGLLAPVPIAVEVVTTLLERDPLVVSQDLDDLCDQSLLLYEEGATANRFYRLHPLLHDYAEQMTIEDERLDRLMQLSTLVVQSIKKYRLKIDQSTNAIECALVLQLSVWPEEQRLRVLNELHTAITGQQQFVDYGFFEALNRLALLFKGDKAALEALTPLVVDTLPLAWNERSKAMGLRVRGLIEYLLEHWTEGINAITEAMSAYRKFNEPEAYGVLGANLIFMLVERGNKEDLQEASARGQELETYLQSHDALSALSRVYRHWALARQDLNDFVGAIELMDKAKPFIWESGDTWRRFSFLRDMATIYLNVGRTAEAENCLTTAEIFIEHNSSLLDAAMLAEAWAKVYQKSNRLPEALEKIRIAIDLHQARGATVIEAKQIEVDILLDMGRVQLALEILHSIEHDIESDLDRDEFERLMKRAIDLGDVD